MRIGVTGATGFVGKHLVTALKDSGTVVTLPRKKALPNKSELKRFVKGTDLVFHLGGVNRDIDEEILKGNILGTSRLLESILNDGKSSARIVFASSSQVYTLADSKVPIRETSKTNPDSIYGVSKLSAENLIRLAGIPYSILRLSNVYGPGCRPNYNSVVATLCDRAVKGLPLMINGDGRQGRDFIYVDDAVRAFMLAGFKGASSSGKVFNVSSGKVISLKQIVNQVSKMHKGVKVEFLANKNISEISYCCDPKRFSGKYGWRPQVSLAKGIEQTLLYFRGRK